MASLFARIASGEIPSIRVYEDDDTFAFMDINPATQGHTLVIPRAEYPDVVTMPPALVAAVALTVQKVARAIAAELKPDGMTIIQNNGAASGQTVFHYHVHIIPRWEGDNALGLWTPHNDDEAVLEATAAAIRARLA